MIIENPDVFKSWLTSILEPLCDADPAALAKYVYALVKKDKPLEELREGMLDQLDVFLQHETKPFVEMLFKSLEGNDYLKCEINPAPSPAAVENLPPALEPEPEDTENHATNGTVVRQPSPPPSPPRHRVVVRGVKPAPRPPQEHTLVKVLPLNELLDEPVDPPPRRRDRRLDTARDKEDRRRRRSRSWERRARNRRHGRDTDVDRRRIPSRSPSPRGRYRNRSPPLAVLDRPASRSRSRSPGPLREHERERDRLRPPRELERDRISRDREHRDRVSRSRDRDRSRERSRERSGSPRLDPRLEHDAYKRRCRDFDEKGYCMRGDLCQWDHGTDPVVLEDSALTRVLTIPPPPPEYNPLTPDIWVGGGFAAAFPHHHLPPRELIPIPRSRDAAIPNVPAPPRHPAPIKKSFDYNRLSGVRAGPGAGAAAAGGPGSLVVRRVPRGLNDIAHLNNHFSKFGKIVNIQVSYENDPEAALITFSNHTEASVAYKSTEAVLNNRFIKVFWYSSENKQENNHPPPRQQPKDHQNVLSLNKVLINKDNIKATEQNKQIQLQAEKQALKEKEAVNGVEPKKEPLKPLEKNKQVMEMHKRAQALLHTQLQQQVLLIQKLESPNTSETQKTALLEAINSAQEGIEKLRKELVAYSKTITQMQNSKKPKTREEAQKEILDAELDMFTKQQEGQDVTELVKKITELRRQMALNFPVHSATRKTFHSRGGRFNPAMRLSRTTPRFVNQSVDHRPRALLVSGFEPEEKDELLAHFAQYGEVTGSELNLAVPELRLQYKLRAQAELAAARGRHYSERTLSITWVNNNKPIGVLKSPAQNGDAHNNNKTIESPQETTEDNLLRFDEEDEEDAEEDRSWRR